jgi:Protein of unknown function (DUF551)
MDAEQQAAIGTSAAEGARSNWIRIDDRLPSLGNKVWVRFATRNGEPRKMNPVKDADFVFYDDHMSFCLEKHRNVYYPPEYCLKAGLTHWQPRLGDIAPSPLIHPAEVARRPRKIKINLSEEERERRADRLRKSPRNRHGQIISVDNPLVTDANA